MDVDAGLFNKFCEGVSQFEDARCVGVGHVISKSPLWIVRVRYDAVILFL